MDAVVVGLRSVEQESGMTETDWQQDQEGRQEKKDLLCLELNSLNCLLAANTTGSSCNCCKCKWRLPVWDVHSERWDGSVCEQLKDASTVWTQAFRKVLTAMAALSYLKLKDMLPPLAGNRLTTKGCWFEWLWKSVCLCLYTMLTPYVCLCLIKNKTM